MIDQDMTDWHIVVAGGLVLVGLLKGSRLGPVYELRESSFITQSPGQPALVTPVNRQVRDFLDWSSIASIEVPAGAIIVPLRHLSVDDRKALLRGIDGLEQLKKQARSKVLIAPGSLEEHVRTRS